MCPSSRRRLHRPPICLLGVSRLPGAEPSLRPRSPWPGPCCAHWKSSPCPRVLCPVSRRAGPSLQRAAKGGGRDPGLSGLSGSRGDHRSGAELQASLSSLECPRPGCSGCWDSASRWSGACLGTSGRSARLGGVDPTQAALPRGAVWGHASGGLPDGRPCSDACAAGAGSLLVRASL